MTPEQGEPNELTQTPRMFLAPPVGTPVQFHPHSCSPPMAAIVTRVRQGGEVDLLLFDSNGDLNLTIDRFVPKAQFQTNHDGSSGTNEGRCWRPIPK